MQQMTEEDYRRYQDDLINQMQNIVNVMKFLNRVSKIILFVVFVLIIIDIFFIKSVQYRLMYVAIMLSLSIVSTTILITTKRLRKKAQKLYQEAERIRIKCI
jgi:ABC-type bacteriocin/lantibiotic exporter with double-glycine peptidase domain